MGLVITQFGDCAKALFTHCCHVNCGGQGVEGLVGADIGCGPFPTYVLLPGLESKYVTRLAIFIEGPTREATGHLPDVFLFCGKEANVGPPVAGRNA